MRFCDLEKCLREVLFIPFEVEEGIMCNRDDSFDTLTWGNKSAYAMCEFDKKLIEIRILVYFYLKNKEENIDELPNNISDIVKKYLPKDTGNGVGLNKGMSFYTIVPETRMGISEVEVMKFREFLENFFLKKKHLFKKVHFCLESGKHEKQPNLHAHFLAWFHPKGGKNFSRELNTEWNKVFEKKYRINYKHGNNRGMHRVPCNTDKIIKDKIDYMTNSLKGSHENFIDLGINKIYDFESSTSQ